MNELHRVGGQETRKRVASTSMITQKACVGQADVLTTHPAITDEIRTSTQEKKKERFDGTTTGYTEVPENIGHGATCRRARGHKARMRNQPTSCLSFP